MALSHSLNHKSPDLISDEELREYFGLVKNVKKYSQAASTIAICDIARNSGRSVLSIGSSTTMPRTPSGVTCQPALDNCPKRSFTRGEETPNGVRGGRSCGVRYRQETPPE